MWRRLLVTGGGIGLTVLQFGCIAHCTFEFVADFVVCNGPSMQPTITDNDILLTEHISVAKRTVKVGDVVISRSVSDPNQFVCKRVKGLEGDYISNYNVSPASWAERMVPRGHVWLEGDNQSNSTDSRSYGPVPYGMLRSRAVYKVWPPSGIGRINDNKNQSYR